MCCNLRLAPSVSARINRCLSVTTQAVLRPFATDLKGESAFEMSNHQNPNPASNPVSNPAVMNTNAETTDSSGSSAHKLDPVERRRVQNRVSQRNHRESTTLWVDHTHAAGRKMRDRIAKLQERVIASELRAAACVDAWDQPNSTPGYASYEAKRPGSPPTTVPLSQSDASPSGIHVSCSALGQIPLLGPAACTPFLDGDPELDISMSPSSLSNTSPCLSSPSKIIPDSSLYLPGTYHEVLNQASPFESLNIQSQSPSNLSYVVRGMHSRKFYDRN